MLHDTTSTFKHNTMPTFLMHRVFTYTDLRLCSTSLDLLQWQNVHTHPVEIGRMIQELKWGRTDSRVIWRDYFFFAKQLCRGTVSFDCLAAGNNSTPDRQICLKTETDITVILWLLWLCETARMFHSADLSYLVTKEGKAKSDVCF